MSNIQVIVGAQYGSEGKGALTGYLARRRGGLAVRVGGSQAGHTVIDDNGGAWPLRHIPVAAVVNPRASLLLGPGSEIDLDVLAQEIADLEAAGFSVHDRLWVHPQATVIDPEHKGTEARSALTDRLGSTAKGVGAARAERIMRRARTYDMVAVPPAKKLESPLWSFYRMFDEIQIEGVQGYALGLHAGWYPFCTSSDCTAIDFLAMAGIAAPWYHDVEVWMAIRPNPIRVAGNSGPMLEETTWEDLGLQPEYTTVTKKVRRVGHWDSELVENAAIANGVDPRATEGPLRVKAALTMADHRWPTLANRVEPLSWSQDEWPQGLAPMYSELTLMGIDLRLLGTGPDTMCEVVE